MKEILSSGTVHLLLGLELWDLIPLAEKMRTDINGEASEKQPPEDEAGFVIIRKKGEHHVHQMRGFLSGEGKGYQGLKSLIIIQRVERDEMLTENTVRVSGRRGADQIQDL